jgi:hypothetical protein
VLSVEVEDAMCLPYRERRALLEALELDGRSSTSGAAPSAGTVSTVRSSVIRTARQEGIPWARLSPKALTIASLVAVPISNGLKQNEVAILLGRPPEWVSESLVELESEIAELLEARDY